MNRNNEEIIEKVFTYYSKPSIAEINLYENATVNVKKVFLKLVCVRKIEVSNSQDEEEIIRKSKCTCPDWFKKGICQHLLACLGHEEKINLSAQWKRARGRGRPPKVSGALSRG